jgi:deoxyribodipyrimidine photolyase-related protein
VSYPTSRPEAIALLQDFLDKKIHRFGELEDAMYTHDEYVHHSLLSTSINFGLLTPWEVIDAIAQTDTANNNKE